MNLKLRIFLRKFPKMHNFLREISYGVGGVKYRALYNRLNYQKLFNELKGSKQGEKCFIIGNGPSLRPEDLDRIYEYDSFGANEIHRILHKTKWRPTYYVIADRYSQTRPEEIRDVSAKMKFISDYYWRFHDMEDSDIIVLRGKIITNLNRVKISDDLNNGVYLTTTVSYVSMQLAAIMGYSEIYLLGFDHNYAFTFDEHGNIIHNPCNSSHFYQDKVPENIIANVYGMTRSYEKMKEYCERNNIRIYNATREGMLNTFDKVDFDSMF